MRRISDAYYARDGSPIVEFWDDTTDPEWWSVVVYPFGQDENSIEEDRYTEDDVDEDRYTEDDVIF